MRVTSLKWSSLVAASLVLVAPISVAAEQPAAKEAGSTEGTVWLNRQMAALAARHGGTGWRTTASGLRWRRIAGDGTGARPGPADPVTVHYVGTLDDGSEFDSSVRRGQPATFPLNRVIKGWQEGVMLMGVGDKFEFAIPYQLAYGADGQGPIPGNATLLFTVELLNIQSAPVRP